jgi:aspartate dehydrogenase
VLASGIDLIAASVGALAEEETLEALTKAAASGGAQLFIPAGALAGIDALAAARLTGVSSVTYSRRAPTATWVKSGALSGQIADGLRMPHTVFDGSAREAALRFPKNANVAATVALAGLGFDRTRTMLLADPAVSANIHEIVAVGAFGRFRTELAAQPIAGTTSSAIVAGSLARAVLSRMHRITV